MEILKGLLLMCLILIMFKAAFNDSLLLKLYMICMFVLVFFLIAMSLNIFFSLMLSFFQFECMLFLDVSEVGVNDDHGFFKGIHESVLLMKDSTVNGNPRVNHHLVLDKVTTLDPASKARMVAHLDALYEKHGMDYLDILYSKRYHLFGRSDLFDSYTFIDEKVCYSYFGLKGPYENPWIIDKKMSSTGVSPVITDPLVVPPQETELLTKMSSTGVSPVITDPLVVPPQETESVKNASEVDEGPAVLTMYMVWMILSFFVGS